MKTGLFRENSYGRKYIIDFLMIRYVMNQYTMIVQWSEEDQLF